MTNKSSSPTPQQILNKYPNLPKRLLVTWNLYCANDVKHLMKDDRSLRALEVVERWLVGEANDQELEIAAKEARDAVYFNASPAYASASDAIDSCTSAYSASYYYASSSYVSHYASFCYPERNKQRNRKKVEYRDKLLQLIDNMSEIEKVLFLDKK